MNDKARLIQEKYYEETANKYDELHIDESCLTGHRMALHLLVGMIELNQVKSILDIGTGTGRTLLFLKEKFPNLKVVGIEPVEALRLEGYKKGISKEELISGDGYNLNFSDATFDLVTEFGVLHHLEKPELVIDEMFRVAKIGVFISDGNNFGQGSILSRMIKAIFRTLKLWSAYQYIITKGKMYQISKGDGLYYSYSVFNNFEQIKRKSKSVHFLNTSNGGKSPLYSAETIALFAVKK